MLCVSKMIRYLQIPALCLVFSFGPSAFAGHPDPSTINSDIRLKVWNYGGWGPGQHEIFWQYATLGFTPVSSVSNRPCCDSVAFDSLSSNTPLTNLSVYSGMQGYQGLGLPQASMEVWAFPLNWAASYSNLSDPGILAQANLRNSEFVGSCAPLPSFAATSPGFPGSPGSIDALIIHNRTDFGIDCSSQQLDPQGSSYSPINPTGFASVPSDPASGQLAKDGSWLVDVDVVMPNSQLPPNQQVTPGDQQNPKPLPPSGPSIASWFDHYDLMLYSKKSRDYPANGAQFPFYLGVRPVDSQTSRLFYQEFVQVDPADQVGLFRKAWGTEVEQSNVLCVSDACQASGLVPVAQDLNAATTERYAHATVSLTQPLIIPARLGYRFTTHLNNTQVHIFATRISDGKKVEAVALPDSDFDTQVNLLSAKSRFSGLYPSAGGVSFVDTFSPDTLRKYAPVSSGNGVDASQFRYVLMLDDVPGAVYTIDCQVSGAVNFSCSDLQASGSFNKITLQGRQGPVRSGTQWGAPWNTFTVGETVYGNLPQPFLDPYPLYTMTVTTP